MSCYRILLVLICFTNYTNSQNYTASFKYTLIEEKVPEFLIKNLNTINKTNNITVNDLLQVLHYEEINLSETKQILYEINKSNDTHLIDIIETFLNFTKTPFQKFFNEFMISLNISSRTLVNVLNELNVDPLKFSSSLIFEPEIVYNILRSGIYEEENIDNALKVINFTSEQVFNVTKKLYRLELMNIDLNILLNSVGNDIIFKLWDLKNISIKDVFENIEIQNLINTYLNQFNNKKYLGVYISPLEFVVHTRLLNSIKIEYEDLEFVSIIIDSNEEIIELNIRESVSINEEITLFPLIKKPSAIINYINISKAENDGFGNCTYITLDEDKNLIKFRNENVKLITNENFDTSILVEYATHFTIGGPLICNNKLYGLARERLVNSSILFDNFNENYTKDQDAYGGVSNNKPSWIPTPSTNQTMSDTTNISIANVGSSYSLFMLLIVLFVCMS